MQANPPLEYGRYYHVYNRGVNGANLFYTASNYEHFLRLYERYLIPVVDTFAWCLLRNHFHLLIRVKEADEIIISDLPRPVGAINTDDGVKKQLQPAYRYFSHLFNAYCQAINKQQARTGALFERPFHRKMVDSEKYFQQLVIYIHNNPVHHGFCSHPVEYAWSSYQVCISEKPTHINREIVIGWFGDKRNFVSSHNSAIDNNAIDHLTIE